AQLAVGLFLTMLRLCLGGGAGSRLPLGLDAGRSLLSFAGCLRIRDFHFLALHVRALLAHFDAYRFCRRATTAAELEFGGFTALERDAARLAAGGAAARLLLQVAEQSDFILGRDHSVGLVHRDPGFLELQQQLI